MEIKKIKNYVANYPNTNEVSKKKVKTKMPQKFLKLGIAAVILKTFPSKVNASIISAPLAGDIEYVEPISVQIAGGVQYINPIYTVSTNLEIVALGVLALSLISIGITKVLNKIKKIDKPAPKVLKILAIVSAMISVLVSIGIIIFGN
jgi:hypothetical protein